MDVSAGPTAHPGKQPGGDLPVPAHPTMSAGDVARVPRRMLFVQCHIAEQGGTGIRALNQVMAENRVFGKVAAALLEGIDVVNTLPYERPFAKQVLVHIRDDTGVRIDSRIPGIQLREARSQSAE